jgi:hypothetical protein
MIKYITKTCFVLEGYKISYVVSRQKEAKEKSKGLLY